MGMESLWQLGSTHPACLRDQLGIVVLLPLQQLRLPPAEEVLQCHLCITTDSDFVPVAPHLQANQGHTQAQRLVKLQRNTVLVL